MLSAFPRKGYRAYEDCEHVASVWQELEESSRRLNLKLGKDYTRFYFHLCDLVDFIFMTEE